MAENRKISKKSFGGYRLISVKDYGSSWDGCIWVKSKSLKEFDEMTEEEQKNSVMTKCPKDVPSMCFPACGYPMVRSECKECNDMEGNTEGNCPFLVRYADTGDYGCRYLLKNADRLVYQEY